MATTAPPTHEAPEAALPLEPFARGLHFPTSITFDAQGQLYVAESGLPFGGAPAGGRIWRIGTDCRDLLAEGLRTPVTGLTCHDGALYVSEGGQPGRILRLGLDGGPPAVVLDNLPGGGNYQTNMTAFGPDGRLYFSQGAATNTSVLGLDALDIGWLKKIPHPIDVPGLEIELTGVRARTGNPLHPGTSAVTGPFAQFNTAHPAGTRIRAELPCTSAVMSCAKDGSDLKLVAWGLRNAFGLLFLPDGRLLATDQGADDRGSRPVGGVPELLFEVREGAWYGWPDFIGGVPVHDPRFAPEQGEAPGFVLANHDELPTPQTPLVSFEPHVSAVKMDHTPEGRILVALFGDEIPMTAPSGPRVGRSLALLDPADWSSTPLTCPLKRPIDVRFGPDGYLYALDFGHFEPGKGTMDAAAGSGAIWRMPW
ncbi:PQQ-dependent sugar dehydrogenase [Streptomyces sp. NPDC057302]|uniref:PQQ-dependent sugar dehydrogenase n=1 Tax=Streptomyces sp. NPDC057302 TaxID=3346094 RepID=UPI003645CD5E